MKLTINSTFAELKSYFDLMSGQLPDQLDAVDNVYFAVEFQANVWISQVQGVIDNGENPAKSEVSTHAKKMLYQLYEDLKVKENWDKPLEKL